MILAAREVRLKPKIRAVLEARCRAPTTPQRDVKRARIVLLAAQGRSTRSIAQEVGVQPRIVSNWRRRFADHGLEGLKERRRPGKKPIYGKTTNSASFRSWIGHRRRATGAGRDRYWLTRSKMSACSTSGVFFGLRRSTWPDESLGARATTRNLPPTLRGLLASISPRLRMPLSSVSMKSRPSRRWSGRRAI